MRKTNKANIMRLSRNYFYDLKIKQNENLSIFGDVVFQMIDMFLL